MTLNFEFDEEDGMEKDLRVPLSTDFLPYAEEEGSLDAEAYPSVNGLKRRWSCCKDVLVWLSQLQDPFFLALFLVHSAVIFWLAAAKGVPAVMRGRDGWTEVGLDALSGDEVWKAQGGGRTGAGSVELTLLLTVPVAVALSGLWIKALLWMAGGLIRGMFLAPAVAFAVGASAALGAGMVWLATVLFATAVCVGFVSCLGVCGWGTTKADIIGRNLKVACLAVTASPSTVTAAVFVLLLHGLWGVIWGLAAVGTVTRYGSRISGEGGEVYLRSQCETQEVGGPSELFLGCDLAGLCTRCVCDGVVVHPYSGCAPEPKVSILAVVLLILSLKWGCSVLSNVLHCVSAGAVGAWWFGRDEGTAVLRSLERALTTYFGTICLASLVAAIAGGIRGLLGCLRRNRRRSWLCPLKVLLGLAERAVAVAEGALAFFNRYTLCHTAIYGGGYKASGAEVLDVLGRRCWTALTGDVLVDCILFLGSLAVASLCGVFGYLLAYSRGLGLGGTEAVMAALAGALLGGLMCMASGRVVSSSLAATLVLFAKDPEALSFTHQEEYADLREAYVAFGYNV